MRCLSKMQHRSLTLSARFGSCVPNRDREGVCLRRFFVSPDAEGVGATAFFPASMRAATRAIRNTRCTNNKQREE